MVKVLISDKMSPRAADVFRERGIEVDEKPGLSSESLAQIIGDYDGLAIRSATKVTSKIVTATKGRLKVIGRAGIGVDNIDQDAATSHGICIMNTPFGNSITTAEHTISLMMAMARQIPAADRSTHDGKWEKNRFMGVELYGKVLGVIGCGNIGAIVSDRAIGLKMRVVAYDPFLSEEKASELGIERVGFDDLLIRADFITLHTPLNDMTRGIINRDTIAKMKPGVHIVNCARGGLIVEDDLRAAIDSGQVAGAAIDVFSSEPAKENVLFGSDSVVATPHLGAATNEAQINVAVQVAEQMSDYLLTGAISNALNMASVSAEEAPRLRPYFALARDLGSFAGQLTNTALKAVHVEFEGHVAGLNTRPLVAIVLEGLLRPMMGNVNMINAPLIAKQRGIEVRESRDEGSGDYQNLIRVGVTTEMQTRDVAGTLFAENRPRIVQVKGINLEAELVSHMLYITNEDKPGLIGSLGTLLGESGINVATFHLGRAKPGGDAVALLGVDQPVNDAVLTAVRKLPHVAQAQALNF